MNLETSLAYKPAQQDSQPFRVRQVLLAYDGSQHAQAALALVEDLFGSCAGAAEGPACRINILSVMPTQHFGQHEQLQAMLNEIQAQREQKGIPVEICLKTGNPAATLNAYSEEIEADLIVLGAQGLRATFGILLGGVAQQVVEYANRPVLVVRAPYHGLKRVLAITDGSRSAERMIEYLSPPCRSDDPAKPRCAWLPATSAISLMHVLPAPIPPENLARVWTLGPEVMYPAPIDPPDLQALMEEEETYGRRVLSDAKDTFAHAGTSVETIMRRGDAATEVLEFARRNSVDLIVCGSRGLSEVTGWLLGSVSRKLVHYAPCSVLIFKSSE